MLLLFSGITTITLSDTVSTVSDSLAHSTSFRRAISDQATTFSEILLSPSSKPRTLSDTDPSMSDSAVKQAIFNRAITDIAETYSEFLRVGQKNSKSITDTATTGSESVVLILTKAKQIQDYAIVSGMDVLSRVAVYNRNVPELAVAQGEHLTRIVNHFFSVTDTAVSYSESIIRSRIVTFNISDTAASIADLLAQKGTRLGIVVDNATVVIDLLNRNAAFARAIVDTGSTVVDTISSHAIRSMQAADNVLISESVVANAVHFASISEMPLTISDSASYIYTHVPVVFSRALSDSMASIIDSVTAIKLVDGPLQVNPNALSIQASGVPQVISVFEQYYGGPITATSSNTAVCTVTASVTGPGPVNLTITPGSSIGSAVITITDNHGGSVPIAVTSVGSTLNFTIKAGVVAWAGKTFNVPAFSGAMPSSGFAEFGAQVDGMPPTGTALPAIVLLPFVAANSTLTGLASFSISRGAGGTVNAITQLSDFYGVELWRIYAQNGRIVGSQDVRTNGGISLNNLRGGALQAPLLNGAAVITEDSSDNGTNTTVNCLASVTNVPQGGLVNKVAWYLKLHSTGITGTWNPWVETALGGLPSPPAIQTLQQSYAQLPNGTKYDFAIAFVGLDGNPGPKTTITGVNGYTVQPYIIPSSYFLGNGTAAPAPVVTSSSATNLGPILNGLSEAVKLQVSVNNQPIDGTCVRVGFWFRVYNPITPADWSTLGSIAASINTTTPTQLASYTETFTQITNGINWEFGISYIGLAGAEGPVASIGNIDTVTAVSISTNYLKQGTGAAPIVLAGPSYSESPDVAGISTDVTLNVSFSNQPADGSILGLVWFYITVANTGFAQQSIATGIESVSQPVSNSMYSFTFQSLSNSIDQTTNDGVYIFGIAYQYTNGTFGTIKQFSNYRVQTVFALPRSLLLGSGVIAQPTVTSPRSASNLGASLDGVNEIVSLVCTVNNQPIDGSISRIGFWYRVLGSSFQFSPLSAVPFTGTTNTQTYAETLTQIPAGVLWEFGVSYIGVGGAESLVTSFATIDIVKPVSIGSNYLKVGTGVGPVISTGPSYSEAPDVSGISTDVTVSIGFNNQPADNSIVGIVFYSVTQAPAGATQPILSSGPQFVVQVNQFAFYAPTFTSLSNAPDQTSNNGVYIFGVSYLYANGNTSLVTQIGVYRVQQVLAIPGQYLAGNKPIANPHIKGAATIHNLGAILAGINEATAITVTLDNQPADGSLMRIGFWYRQFNAYVWTFLGGIQPQVPSTYTNIEFTELSVGINWEFGISYIGFGGAESPVTSMGTIDAINVPAIPGNFLKQGSNTAIPVTYAANYTETPNVTGISTDLTASILFDYAGQPTIPRDGSVVGIAFFHIAYVSQAVSVPALPTGIDAVIPLQPIGTYYSFTFPGLMNSHAGVTLNYEGTYLLGVAYVYANGSRSGIAIGPPYTITQQLNIPTTYLLGNVSYVPSYHLVSGPYVASSLNGINASVAIGLSIDNQPSNGSARKIMFYYRVANIGSNYSPYSDLPAQGPGTPRTDLSANDYEFTYSDLIGGQAYDFGFAMQDARGGRTAIYTIVSNFTAKTKITLPPGSANGVPAGVQITTVGAGYNITIFNVSHTFNADVSYQLYFNTSDFSWVDHSVAYIYTYDPQNPGRLQQVATEQLQRLTPTGSFHFAANSLAFNYPNSGYQYGIEVRVYAGDGSYVFIGFGFNSYNNPPNRTI